MMMHDEIPEVSSRELRHFGLLTGAILAGLFGLLFPWLFERSIPPWPWVIAGVLGAWALVAPASLRPVYRGWMRIGMAMGWVMSRVILSILFFLLLTPVGFVGRRYRQDPMARPLDREAESYRVPTEPRANNHLEKPF